MLQGKRKLKKEQSSHNTLIAVIIGFLIFVALGVAVIITYFIYTNSTTFLNPLAINKNSPKIKIEDKLNEKNIKYIRSSLESGDSLEVELKDGGKIIFSTKKDIEKQVASLQLMLSRLTIEGKRLKILDFRYSNPVVSFY